MLRPAPEFKDHFSAIAAEYRDFRPDYPRALFDYLAALAPSRSLAWDCATGSGQVARALAPHFDLVLGTDASAAQIDSAVAHPRVAYRVAPAEQAPLADRSVQLITVAQALHWFDLPRFFAEAARVLASRGVLAVWSYGVLRADDPDINALVAHLYDDVLGPYWPPERRLVETGLAEVDLPFAEQEAPGFSMQASWRRDQLLGYLGTWSAVRRYRRATGRDPLETFARKLGEYWTDAGSHLMLRWPLHLRVAVAS